MICLLLYSIVSISKKNNISTFIRKERLITFFPVCNITKSSASIKKVMTLFCLLALYIIASTKNFITYPWEFF